MSLEEGSMRMMSNKNERKKYAGDSRGDCSCTDCFECKSGTSLSCKCEKMSAKDSTSMKIPVTPPESGYFMQIVNTGLTNDNKYEANVKLAPEIDASSIKITVKNNNLRVAARRPLGDLAEQLPQIRKKSALGDLVKRTLKHSENFLIPEIVDAEKVRATMDNELRILTLTAPPRQKIIKVKKKKLSDG